MIVTLTANPSVDRTYLVGTLRPGGLHRARAGWSEASGKGVNVSRVLGRLGVPARTVVTAGGGEGRLLLDLLAGLDGVTAVPVAGRTRVNVTVVVDSGEPTKVNEPGSPLSGVEADALLAALERALVCARWLACCGSLPSGTDPALVGRLVATGRAARVPVAVDASGPALEVAVAHRADLLKPNRDELAELAGGPVGSVAAAYAAAREVAGRTGGAVLVSLGADGALLVTAHGAWSAQGPPITPVNTTGAGDALLAGFLAADGAAPAGRLASAVAVATSACLSPATADLPDRLVSPAAVTVRPL
ncbi:MAG TPA: hexose kinase [Asanoa sp.]